MILVDKKGHMISNDSYHELHDFALQIGLKREWFQEDHYDLTTSRMIEKAKRFGAKEVSSKEIVRNMI
jgi:hypothetical protein